MGNIKKEDILIALAVLKDMCSANDTCVDCPAYMGICRIQYQDPEDYDLNIGDDVWRAFK